MVVLLDFSPGPRELEWILKNHTYHHAVAFGRTIAGSEMPPVQELSLILTVGAGDSVGIDRSLSVGEFPEIRSFAARLLSTAGQGLHAGEKILCGALNPTALVEPGQRVVACLRPFGELALDTR